MRDEATTENKDSGGDEDINEEMKLEPPGDEVVANRALCLGALVMRCEFEQVIQSISKVGLNEDSSAAVIGAHEEMIAGLNAWLNKEGINGYLSAEEKRMLAVPAGEWNKQDMINASWRTESLAVLLWSLSEMENIPPYDVEVEQQPVISKLGLNNSSRDFINRTKLRNKTEIDSARDIAEVWHWRARTTQLFMEGRILPQDSVGGGLTVEQVINLAAQNGYESGELLKPIDGDFVLFGKPYRDLDEQEYGLAMSIAIERHYALNWLCGYAEDWDNVPTDT